MKSWWLTVQHASIAAHLSRAGEWGHTSFGRTHLYPQLPLHRNKMRKVFFALVITRQARDKRVDILTSSAIVSASLRRYEPSSVGCLCSAGSASDRDESLDEVTGLGLTDRRAYTVI
jgi:hypothetical protein